MGEIGLGQYNVGGLITATLGALLCHSATVHAFEVSWYAPEDCPQVDSVQKTLVDLVGRQPGGPPELDVTIRRLSANEWHALLQVGSATREVRGNSCLSVSDAITVILAMTIDGEASGAMPGSSEAAATETAPRNDTSPSVETVETVAGSATTTPTKEGRPAPPPVFPRPLEFENSRLARKGFGWGASLRALAEFGRLPSASWGGAAVVRAGTRRQFAEVSVSALLPRAASLPEPSTAGGEFYWWGGELQGCPAIYPTGFVCVGFEAGHLLGRGFGVRNPASGGGWLLGPTLRLLWRLPLAHRLRLEAALGAFAGVVRPEFELKGSGRVHRPNTISGRLELGIGWDP